MSTIGKTPKLFKDTASNQLKDWKERVGDKEPDVMARPNGAPIGNITHSLTVGPRGPVLIQDQVLFDEMAHFNRERVPERVVHAKGTGAFGHFEVTDDITKYTKASIFAHVGKRTPLAVRFSGVLSETGAPDANREIKGFALKFYTDDGNWDLVGNNTPLFFIRDGILFPHFIHSQKRNPQTNLKDMNMFWDFLSLRPESVHQTLFMFGDRGIPDGYRHMDGFGANTFKLVNEQGEQHYCKFIYKTDQGNKFLTTDQAGELAALDPDGFNRDLWNSIAEGNFPSWTFFIQIMTLDQAKKAPFNPFDVTKTWPHKEFPLIRVGKFVLNKNPENYYTQVEQLAFSPGNMVPGIEASPDPMLQTRLFAYTDTQRHRIGPNFMQLPINQAVNAKNRDDYRRAGPLCFSDNHMGAPNYYPNSFGGPQAMEKFKEAAYEVSGIVDRHDDPDTDIYSQPRTFYHKVLDEAARKRMIDNIAGHLMNAAPFIQERALKNFSNVDQDFSKKISQEIERRMAAPE